jgi:hypothetical protein
LLWLSQYEGLSYERLYEVSRFIPVFTLFILCIVSFSVSASAEDGNTVIYHTLLPSFAGSRSSIVTSETPSTTYGHLSSQCACIIDCRLQLTQSGHRETLNNVASVLRSTTESPRAVMLKIEKLSTTILESQRASLNLLILTAESLKYRRKNLVCGHHGAFYRLDDMRL